MNRLVESRSFFNRYFDSVYVLNVPALPRRRISVTWQMRNLGIGFEFVEGIDASVASAEEIKDAFRIRGKSPHPPYLLAAEFPDLETLRAEMSRSQTNPGLVLTPGRLCCGLGHLMVMERMIADGAKRALILEDDIVFADHADEILRECARELEGAPIHGNWDLVLFGSGYVLAETTPWQDRPNLRPWAGVMAAGQPGRAGGRSRILGPDGSPLEHIFIGHREWHGTHCYAVSERCARFLVSVPMMVNADGLLAQAGKSAAGGFEVHISHPFLAYQCGDPSYIDRVDPQALGFGRKDVYA